MEEQYQKVTLEVGEWKGKWGYIHEVDFNGRLIAEARIETGDVAYPDNSGIAYQIYETAKGKIVLLQKNWDCRDGGTEKSEMEIFASIDELEGKAPIWLVRDAQKALGLDVVEHLDI